MPILYNYNIVYYLNNIFILFVNEHLFCITKIKMFFLSDGVIKRFEYDYMRLEYFLCLHWTIILIES